ncbi:MAG: hypothetical protein Q9197_004616 [Variospora fuerteventurae]
MAHLVADVGRNVAEAVNLVNGPNPPPWMLTFNEPDYSYKGFTPKMSPQEAAEAIKPLLAKPGKNTFRPNELDKPIWITEIAAGNTGCSLGWDAVHQYMKDIYKFAMNSGYIDRVFWNTGNPRTLTIKVPLSGLESRTKSIPSCPICPY